MPVFPREGNTALPDNRASSGGVTSAKEIANYSPPKGPTSINDPKSPGLHGTVHPCGSQK